MDLKGQPWKLERLFHQAVGFHQGGNLAEAAKLYGKIIAVDPSGFMPRHLLGLLRYQQGQHTEALALIAGALRINPKFPEALSNYGLVLKTLGRLNEALLSLDKALAIKPDYVGALNNRGNVLLDLNRLDEALLSYDKVLAIDPNSSQGWNNRGNALYQLKRLKDALASCEKALAIKPDYAEAHRNRGKVLYDLERREEALSSYHQALKSKADPVEVLYSCGFILQELKRFEEALANYDNALAIKPDYAEALNNRGVTLSELKRLEEAIPSFDRALSIKPDYTGAWNNRGLAFWELKRPEEALANYDRALAINPDYAEALNNRGNALRALNRFEDAIASYQRALAADPDYLHALSGLANSALSVCDWPRTAALRGDLITRIAAGRSEIQPFLMLGYALDRTILSIATAVGDFSGCLLASFSSRSGGLKRHPGRPRCRRHALYRHARPERRFSPGLDHDYVLASIAAAIVFGVAATLVFDKFSGLAGLATAAILFAASISGMHFTGMSAVTLVPDPGIVPSGLAIPSSGLALAVSAIAIFIVALGQIGAQLDRVLAIKRAGEAERHKAYIAQLEANKAELNKALHEASAANEAKSAFLAIMSHELRTPLNAIIGFAELMRTRLFGPLGHGKYEEYIEDIHSSGSHLLSLINDILDLSRLDAGKAELTVEQFSLCQLTRDVCRSLTPLARREGLKLVTDLPPDLPWLSADERRIRQVVLNLASNAIKFTPCGGTITLKVSVSGSGLVFEIRDTGIGISQADLPKVLERFGQVDNSFSRKHQGTGLGLPLAKQLEELHGGRFDIESEPGVGTAVTIVFPVTRLIKQAAPAAPIIPKQ